MEPGGVEASLIAHRESGNAFNEAVGIDLGEHWWRSVLAFVGNRRTDAFQDQPGKLVGEIVREVEFGSGEQGQVIKKDRAADKCASDINRDVRAEFPANLGTFQDGPKLGQPGR